MSKPNIAKDFELKVRKDLEKAFPNGIVLRLPDQMSGYKFTSQNPCDLISFNEKYLFLIEIKTHKGASIPFDAIPQLDRLKKYVGIKNVRAGIIVWFYEKDIGILYIPIKTLLKIQADGEKSFGLRHLDSSYRYIKVPSTKKIVFYDSDYSCLMDLEDGD